MTFRIRIDRVAQQEIDYFAAHAAAYSGAWAAEQFARLSHIFAVDLAEAPLRLSIFLLTGAPYRPHLFRVGRRTHHWIIYTVDKAARTVAVVRFRNASRDPRQLEA